LTTARPRITSEQATDSTSAAGTRSLIARRFSPGSSVECDDSQGSPTTARIAPTASW
jgi:hypothetical protein